MVPFRPLPLLSASYYHTLSSVRLAVFAIGQGLCELQRLSEVAGEAAGWDDARIRAEADAYAAAVRHRYQIVASPPAARTAA